jgi:co-chaperonin GroES (HSP10)
MSKIRFEPAPGKIVAKVVGESEFLDKGRLIIAPSTRANPRTTAIIIAIYEPFMSGEHETKPFFDVGDKVIFGMHSGIEIEYGRNEKVIILREQEILTKVFADDEDLPEVGVASNGTFDDLDG